MNKTSNPNGFKQRSSNFVHHTFVDLHDALLAAKSGQFWEGDVVTVRGFTYKVGANWELEFCSDPSTNGIEQKDLIQ